MDLLQVKSWSQDWLIAAGAYPGCCSMKRLEVFLLPLDGMLVHRRSLPRNLLGFPQQFTGIQLYNWVERGTESKVSCPRTVSQDRARTRTALSEVERTNQEATASSTKLTGDDRRSSKFAPVILLNGNEFGIQGV